MQIETERLVLRQPEPGDAAAFFEIWNDDDTARFVGGKKTREQAEEMVDRMTRQWEVYGVGLFAVERKEDARVIGRVGYLLWHSERWVPGLGEELGDEVETEVGWVVGREHWNRGYATEAAQACRDRALGELGRARVISLIAPGNAASIRVAEKIGERYEGDVQGEFFLEPVGLWAVGEARA
jgi:RimJ/RimL family protein N-acetyltransferase